MKTTTMRTMIAAAALVVAVGTASAQTYKADIPVRFSAGGQVLAPGTYELRVNKGQGTEMITLHSSETNQSFILQMPVKADAPRNWVTAGDPRLAFECTGGACSLRRMWNGSDPYLYLFPSPKTHNGDLAAHRTEVITLTMLKTR